MTRIPCTQVMKYYTVLHKHVKLLHFNQKQNKKQRKIIKVTESAERGQVSRNNGTKPRPGPAEDNSRDDGISSEWSEIK